MSTVVELAHISGDDDVGAINIFIHGYRSIKSRREFEKISNEIRQSKPSGSVYLLYWKSGSWLAHLGWLRVVYRFTTPARWVNPLAIGIDVVAVLGMTFSHFQLMKRRARKVGLELGDHIVQIPNAHKRPVNFIAHSLGAVVVYSSLSQGDDSAGYRVHDCVFLAGAEKRDAPLWDKCARRISGKIFNGYSEGDSALFLASPARFFVGDSKMKSIEVDGVDKVVNKEVKGVKHTQYWANLKPVLETVWENYRS